MSIEIPINDHGQIRVFQTNRPLSAVAQNNALDVLFGTNALDPTYIDIIKIRDLSSMQLSDYILQGYDLQPADHDVPLLNTIDGYAILVMSAASRGQRVTLKPAPHLRHVTTLLPDVQLTPIERLSSDGADGDIAGTKTKPAKSDARIGGMVATFALIVMFLLVGLMVWVA